MPAPDADYYGHDYDILKDADQNLCETACLSDNQCQAFTFNTAKGWCFLKSEAGELRAAVGVVSGRIAVAATPAETQARDSQRSAELGKLPGLDLDAARSFRLGLAGEARDDAAIAAGEALWPQADAALERRDFAAAMAAYREALRRDPASSRAWLGLGLASLSFTSDDYQAAQDARGLRQPAAINAYLTAGDDREKAAALDFLARGFAGTTTGRTLSGPGAPRSASRNGRTRARGSTRRSPSTASGSSTTPSTTTRRRTHLPELLRSLERVRSRPARRRARLPSGGGRRHAARFGQRPQICVEGVTHGVRYRIVARKGIPSESGETLARNVEVSVYVRDRDPSVRLSGNAYVLPAGGDASIPSPASTPTRSRRSSCASATGRSRARSAPAASSASSTPTRSTRSARATAKRSGRAPWTSSARPTRR